MTGSGHPSGPESGQGEGEGCTAAVNRWLALHRYLAAALLAAAGLLAASPAGASSKADWAAIDRLRLLLADHGLQVVQRDCDRRGLQGLYHRPSATIVICRVHRTPAAVWNTLAHEATHHMQACRGGPITDPAHHPSMARALGRHAPDDLHSLRLYPARERVIELEARYTAQLEPDQVIQLFRRYCGSGRRGALSSRPSLP
ncbi:MAG: hypothetical protein VKI81_10140 [Synechococcaceae cyanobacterium]|nr:hypothetical protein [Synechococcaceae cyanobacterium]